MRKLLPVLTLWVLAAIMLVSAAVSRHPYGFYTLLRWVCCAVFAYSAVTFFQSGRIPWVWLFGILAVLYNPISTIWLARNTWVVLNWLSVGAVVAAAGAFWFFQRDGACEGARGGKLQWLVHYALPVLLGAAIIIEVLIYFSLPEQSARGWHRTGRHLRLPSLRYSR